MIWYIIVCKNQEGFRSIVIGEILTSVTSLLALNRISLLAGGAGSSLQRGPLSVTI